MQSFMDEVDEEELEGVEGVGAQPGASASLREPSRANVPNAPDAASDPAGFQHRAEADRSHEREDVDEPDGPDVSALVDALLGEMQAVSRHALVVRVADNKLSLVTDKHVRTEHDRHLFADAMLELLGAPQGSLVAVQRLTLRATSVLGPDGRAPRAPQRPHDLLQVVVEDTQTAHAVVREANGDAPSAAVYDRAPERTARFVSEHDGRFVLVPFRVVLAGDEARLFPPDSSVVLRAEGNGRALEAVVTALPEAMLNSMSSAVAQAAGRLLLTELQHWWSRQGPPNAHPTGVALTDCRAYCKRLASGRFSCGGLRLLVCFDRLPFCVPERVKISATGGRLAGHEFELHWPYRTLNRCTWAGVVTFRGTGNRRDAHRAGGQASGAHVGGGSTHVPSAPSHPAAAAAREQQRIDAAHRKQRKRAVKADARPGLERPAGAPTVTACFDMLVGGTAGLGAPFVCGNSAYNTAATCQLYMCDSDGGCRAECTPCNGSLGLDRGSTIVFPRAPLPVPAVVPTGGPLPPGLAATVSLASTAATLESLMAAGGQSGPAPLGALTPDATLASVASAAAMPPPPPRLPQRHGGEAGAREDGARVPSRSRSPSESSNPRFREGDGEEEDED